MDFGFTGTRIEYLIAPEVDEIVSKDLDVVLRAAHHENPACKSPDKLVRLLDWAPAMNRTEFYGLLTGSFESPSMSAKHSAVILEAVIKLIARTKAREAFPDYWEIIHDTFDNLLARVCAKAVGDGVPRLNFSEPIVKPWPSTSTLTRPQPSRAASEPRKIRPQRMWQPC